MVPPVAGMSLQGVLATQWPGRVGLPFPLPAQMPQWLSTARMPVPWLLPLTSLR